MQTSTSNVHQSKWGFHACDIETFRKLKKVKAALNQAYLQYLRDDAALSRWSRKQPQNRIVWRAIRAPQGHRTGWENLGPWSQPKPKWPVYDTAGMGFDGINWENEYENARTPREKPEHVIPLRASAEQIDKMLLVIGG